MRKTRIINRQCRIQKRVIFEYLSNKHGKNLNAKAMESTLTFVVYKTNTAINNKAINKRQIKIKRFEDRKI